MQQRSILIVAVTMSSATNSTKLNRTARIAGICADADALGVTRQHLQAVLTGKRESKPLLARYRALRAPATK